MAENGAGAGGINGELPVDLLRQVLSKLPVKSLCRLRCVSKLWCSVISDPLFADDHRACSGDRPELLISFQWDQSICSRTEVYSAPYPLRRSTGLTVQALAPSRRSSIFVQRPMSHQVGGLYCIDSGDSVRICNPATGEFFELGTVFNPFLTKRTVTNHFGFDPVERKHKVISMWSRPYLECYVFVLEDNYWTKIPDNYPSEYSPPRIHDVVCVDGVVFSAAYTGRGSEQILVAFDVRTETFRVIDQQLPGPHWPRLIEFGGRLAILSQAYLVLGRGELSKRITLWVLEDLGQQVWRRKDCAIQLGKEFRNLEGLIIIQGGMRAGELMLAPTMLSFKEEFFLLMYSVDSNAVRRIELRGIPRGLPGRSFNFLRFHVENLQSPKPKHPPV